MPILFHNWLSPHSRKVRLILAEKGISCELKVEMPWERRKEFLKMNPAGDVPVLVNDNGSIIADSNAITEYLNETVPEPTLMGESPEQNAEIRRLNAWFDGKFNKEVSELLISEKMLKRFLKMGVPDSNILRCAHANLKTHMAYINHIAERTNYLAGARLTVADLAAAAHISVIDYFGDIDWASYDDAKSWYMRVKSRQCFRSILKDRIGGLAPPPHYAKLDF